MNPLLQALMGALLALWFPGPGSRWRKMCMGALIALVPDADACVYLFKEPIGAERILNGATHSLAFVVLASPALAWLISLMVEGARQWALRLSFLILLTHIGLDGLGIRGAAWLFPFWQKKWALAILPEIHSGLLLALISGLLVALLLPPKWMRIGAGAALIAAFVTGVFALAGKLTANALFENAFHRQGVSVFRFSTFPTPGNSSLWLCAGDGYGVYQIGYVSVNAPNQQPSFAEVPVNSHLVGQDSLRWLNELTGGFSVLEQKSDTLLIHDLRYGVTQPWQPSGAGICRTWIRDGGGEWQEKRNDRFVFSWINPTFRARIRGEEPVWRTPPAWVKRSSQRVNKSQRDPAK